jgi:hypothetical protein
MDPGSLGRREKWFQPARSARVQYLWEFIAAYSYKFIPIETFQKEKR